MNELTTQTNVNASAAPTADGGVNIGGVKLKNHCLVIVDDPAAEDPAMRHRELVCPNVICKNYITNSFSDIAVGSGTGTPAFADTALFNYVTRKSASASSITTLDGKNPLYSFRNWKRRYVSAAIIPSENVGTVFTELGLSSGTAIVTHALIRDEQGNVTSITKTNSMSIQFIYTLYFDCTGVNLTPDPYTVYYIPPFGGSMSSTLYYVSEGPESGTVVAAISRKAVGGTASRVWDNTSETYSYTASYTSDNPTSNTSYVMLGITPDENVSACSKLFATDSFTGSYSGTTYSMSSPNVFLGTGAFNLLISVTNLVLDGISIPDADVITYPWGSGFIMTGYLGAIASDNSGGIAVRMNPERTNPVYSWYNITTLYASDDLDTWVQKDVANLPEVYTERFLRCHSTGTLNNPTLYYSSTAATGIAFSLTHPFSYYGISSGNSKSVSYDYVATGVKRDGLSYVSGSMTVNMRVN